jgi:hypothetical protein
MKQKFNIAFTLAVILAMVFTSLALADNVNNDVAANPGSDTFTAGGTTSVGYKIVATGGDLQAGCNAADATPATVTINAPAGVTPTPGSLTFTTCNTFQDVTFTSATPGDYSITVSVSDGGTGSYSTGPATFTLHVLVPVVTDSTAPVISYVLNPASPDGANGWYKSNVTLTWTVAEDESPLSLVKTGCVDQNITADQGEMTYSCSATSDGGSADQVDVSIKRDATNPDVSLVGGPADGVSYYFGSVPAAPTCTASDAMSGLDGACTVLGYSALVGPQTVTASALDMAGNNGSASASYSVLAWTLKGFYQPVDMNNVFNVVKGGSTVPLKFEVFAGTELTATSVVKSFVQTKVACDGTAPADDIEVVTTGGTSLRYDTTAGQFIQNWQTPKTAGICYKVTMTTLDNSALVTFFKLK